MTDLRPDVSEHLARVAAGFQAHGMSAADARQGALRALAGGVARQGNVLGFEKTFLVQGLAFIAVLPLLYFLRVGKGNKAEHIDLGME